MANLNKFYFFRCYHPGCGEWYYINRIIKTKKCWKCNRSFQFKNSDKFSKVCSMEIAVAIIKQLKNKAEEKPLPKFITKDNSLRINKK